MKGHEYRIRANKHIYICTHIQLETMNDEV